jgi:hypothetical protein
MGFCVCGQDIFSLKCKALSANHLHGAAGRGGVSAWESTSYTTMNFYKKKA